MNLTALFLLAGLLASGCGSRSLARSDPGCPKFPPPASVRGGAFASTSLGRSELHSPPAHHVGIPIGPVEDVRIVLERSRCFGDCPNYRVELRGTGEVLFEGGDFVTFAGTHQTHVAPGAVQCLLDDFRKVDFWSLDGDYVAHVTDLPTYAVSLTVGGSTKVVTDHAGRSVGMPAGVADLEQAIDQATGTDTWIRGNQNTIPALEAEHFDFQGRRAADLLAKAAQDAPDTVVFGLLDRGVPIDGRVDDEDFDEPITTIEAAAMNGRLTLVRRLIKAGAFAQGGKKLVSATLRASVASRRVDVVAEILKYHPDVNSTDANGETALSLIFLGAHPHAGEKDAPNEDPAIIRLLGKAGANPNLANSEDLLARASSREDRDALIAIGARPRG